MNNSPEQAPTAAMPNFVKVEQMFVNYETAKGTHVTQQRFYGSLQLEDGRTIKKQIKNAQVRDVFVNALTVASGHDLVSLEVDDPIQAVIDTPATQSVDMLEAEPKQTIAAETAAALGAVAVERPGFMERIKNRLEGTSRNTRAKLGAMAMVGMTVFAASFGSLKSSEPAHASTATAVRADGTASTSSTTEAVKPTTSTSEVKNAKGQEAAYDIALQGSCSPYNAEMAAKARVGNFTAFGDFKDVQASFLKQHPDFNTNFTNGARARVPYLFSGLKLDQKSTMADASTNADFAQGSLVNALPNVANTYCDAQGNVNFYTDTVLEAGTGVGGIQITSLQESNGVTVAVLSTGEKVELPANALVADVQKLDGNQIKMLVTNKLGLKTKWTDAKGVSRDVFIGCDNILNKIPAVPQKTIPTTPEITSTSTPNKTTTTTVPKQSTTSSTTTTVPGSTTTTTNSPTTTTSTTAVYTTTTLSTGPKQNPHPPVSGGPATTVEAPQPGPSYPTTSNAPRPTITITTEAPSTIPGTPNTVVPPTIQPVQP